MPNQQQRSIRTSKEIVLQVALMISNFSSIWIQRWWPLFNRVQYYSEKCFHRKFISNLYNISRLTVFLNLWMNFQSEQNKNEKNGRQLKMKRNKKKPNKFEDKAFVYSNQIIFQLLTKISIYLFPQRFVNWIDSFV